MGARQGSAACPLITRYRHVTRAFASARMLRRPRLMHGFILQDWTTVRASSPLGNSVTVTQEPDDWLDLSPFQDVLFWVLAPEVTSTTSPMTLLTLNLQTAPIADESFFIAGTIYSQALIASPTPFIVPALLTTAVLVQNTEVGSIPPLPVHPPLARYVRWQLSGLPPWDATFTIAVSANAPGH
jgi:hypothetical protein